MNCFYVGFTFIPVILNLMKSVKRDTLTKLLSLFFITAPCVVGRKVNGSRIGSCEVLPKLWLSVKDFSIFRLAPFGHRHLAPGN